MQTHNVNNILVGLALNLFTFGYPAGKEPPSGVSTTPSSVLFAWTIIHLQLYKQADKRFYPFNEARNHLSLREKQAATPYRLLLHSDSKSKSNPTVVISKTDV